MSCECKRREIHHLTESLLPWANPMLAALWSIIYPTRLQITVDSMPSPLFISPSLQPTHPLPLYRTGIIRHLSSGMCRS